MSQQLDLRVGPSGDEQETSFQNATLQIRRRVVYSIATYVEEIPDSVPDNPHEIANYLSRLFAQVPQPSEGHLFFDIQVGWDGREDENDG